jgi:hypothetical protein
MSSTTVKIWKKALVNEIIQITRQTLFYNFSKALIGPYLRRLQGLTTLVG